MTLLAAINSEKILLYHIFVGGCNSERFIEFLTELNSVLAQEGPLDMYRIYMNNARPHVSGPTKDCMLSQNVQYHYLSPYSPMLNLIELTFSKTLIRNDLGSNSKNVSLHHLFSTALTHITREDLEGWYRHT